MKERTDQRKKLDQIQKRLKEKGLSMTNQRRQIISEILKSGSHFDLESLAEVLRRRKPTTARATVYRNVKILADAGIVKREMFGETHSHYEVMEKEHGHFVCTDCGRIIELACPTLENFLTTASEMHDFVIQSHSIELFGRCGDCDRKNANKAFNNMKQ